MPCVANDARQYSEELQKKAKRFEDRLNIVENFLARMWLAASTCYFLLLCKSRVGRIRRELGQVYSQAADLIEKRSVKREDVLKQAQQFADISKRLFHLAEKDQIICSRIEKLNTADIWELRVTLWCYKKIFLLHDEAGSLAEDFAETLALSASEPFAELVQRELEDCASMRP